MKYENMKMKAQNEKLNEYRIYKSILEYKSLKNEWVDNV